MGKYLSYTRDRKRFRNERNVTKNDKIWLERERRKRASKTKASEIRSIGCRKGNNENTFCKYRSCTK